MNVIVLVALSLANLLLTNCYASMTSHHLVGLSRCFLTIGSRPTKAPPRESQQTFCTCPLVLRRSTEDIGDTLSKRILLYTSCSKKHSDIKMKRSI